MTGAWYHSQLLVEVNFAPSSPAEVFLLYVTTRLGSLESSQQSTQLKKLHLTLCITDFQVEEKHSIPNHY
jgi:hypothetical protein